MQLTRHTDFAFRSLMFLASMPTDTATIQQIADRFTIPKSHLMKVVSTLSGNGYVRSTRGKQGGISLAKPAADITLKEIVVLMEKTLEPFDCAGQNCIILPSCQLKHAFNGAQEQYLNYLGQYTVADVINNDTSNALHSES